MSVFQKILRAGEGRTLKRMHERVEEINALEDEIATLSDEALRAKTEEFRARFDQGEDLDDLLPEAFACVREASKRTLGMRHFAAGTHPHTVIAALRARHAADTARAPSIRTMRRWCAERRWLSRPP